MVFGVLVVFGGRLVAFWWNYGGVLCCSGSVLVVLWWFSGGVVVLF